MWRPGFRASEFELAAGESVTVTGITGPVGVGAVGPVNERDTYATEGVIGMVSPEVTWL